MQVRALSREYPDRALRMHSLMKTMGMGSGRATLLALIEGCAAASKSTEAYQLYWYVLHRTSLLPSIIPAAHIRPHIRLSS